MDPKTSNEPVDFYQNAPESIYKTMDRGTWWAVRLKQIFIFLGIMPAILVGFGVLCAKWMSFAAAGPDMGEPLMNLLGLLSGPLVLFMFVLRPIWSKLRMYAVYYIPYSAANSKGRAVIAHYRNRYKTLYTRENGKEYGRKAPASGASVFNIPYEYARECYWEHIREGGKVSNCPKLFLPEEHERGLFDAFGRSRTLIYQSPADVTQTEGFKRSIAAAKRIVGR